MKAFHQNGITNPHTNLQNSHFMISIGKYGILSQAQNNSDTTFHNVTIINRIASCDMSLIRNLDVGL